jgi:hypothetical protein
MSLHCEEFFFIEITTKNESNKNEVNPTKNDATKNESTLINNIVPNLARELSVGKKGLRSSASINTIDPFKDVETFLNTFYHYC